MSMLDRSAPGGHNALDNNLVSSTFYMAVTLDQIAQKAGVSRMTVARALNGTTKQTWSSTARRVQEIQKLADDMGYRRNSAAAATRTRRFGHVGMLTRSDVSHLQFNLNKGVSHALARHDLHMTYCEARIEDLADPESAPKLLREHCVDGLIVHLSDEIPPPVIKSLQQLALPVIWVNTKSEFDCVYPDDYGAAYRATQELIGLGHRRILLIPMQRGEPADIARPAGHYSAVAREAGYLDAMRESGLAPLQRADLTRRSDFHAVEDWRRVLAAEQPTAVITAATGEAGFVALAGMSIGWRIPTDLSIVAFHDARSFSDLGPKVSTMKVPMQAVGHKAVDMLVAKLDDVTRRLPSTAVPYSRMGGESVAAPREKDPRPRTPA